MIDCLPDKNQDNPESPQPEDPGERHHQNKEEPNPAVWRPVGNHWNQLLLRLVIHVLTLQSHHRVEPYSRTGRFRPLSGTVPSKQVIGVVAFKDFIQILYFRWFCKVGTSVL